MNRRRHLHHDELFQGSFFRWSKFRKVCCVKMRVVLGILLLAAVVSAVPIAPLDDSLPALDERFGTLPGSFLLLLCFCN